MKAGGNGSEQTSRTGALMRDVRRMPAFHQLIPQEANVGWPLPSRRHGKAYVTLAFFGVARATEERPAQLFAPFATMTLAWRTGKLVAYRHLEYEALWPRPDGPVGTFPHPGLPARRSEYLRLRTELLEMYDELLDGFDQDAVVEDAWSQRFAALLGRLVEPALLPFYCRLAPGFFERFLGATDPESPATEH